jgi:hypothetical protein
MDGTATGFAASAVEAAAARRTGLLHVAASCSGDRGREPTDGRGRQRDGGRHDAAGGAGMHTLAAALALALPS